MNWKYVRSYRLLLFCVLAALPLPLLSVCSRAVILQQSPADTQSPYPKNDSGYSVAEEYSWDFAAAHPDDPRARRNLPYYGSRSVDDIRESLDAIWNRCKFIKYVPGETIVDLALRIQKAVDEVIGALPYKPAAPHLDLLRAAGNETFCICNFTYGDPVGVNGADAKRLDQNVIVNDAKIDEYWAAFCRQPVLKGVCGNIVEFLYALDRLCGVYITGNPAVVVRDDPNQRVEHFATNTNNHAVLGIVLNSDEALWTPLEKAYSRKREALLLKYNYSFKVQHSTGFHAMPEAMTQEWRQLYTHPGCSSFNSHAFVKVYSDPTYNLIGPERRNHLAEILHYPRPQYSFVGAKGDDVFRVFLASCRYPYDTYPEEHGSSMFHVKGLGDSRKLGGAPLPNELARLCKVCANLP